MPLVRSLVFHVEYIPQRIAFSRIVPRNGTHITQFVAQSNDFGIVRSGSQTVYRRLFADTCLYEFVTLTDAHTGMYYTTENVSYTDDDNLLYWVTNKIMLATYATLLSKGKQEKVGDVDTYRYDFAYQGNQYSLWYDDSNLVQISATFVQENSTDTETYTATFANYLFEEVSPAPFDRPDEAKDALYVKSLISFEDWMSILNRFGNRAAHWM